MAQYTILTTRTLSDTEATTTSGRPTLFLTNGMNGSNTNYVVTQGMSASDADNTTPHSILEVRTLSEPTA